MHEDVHMHAQTDKSSGRNYSKLLNVLFTSDQSVCGLLCYQYKDLSTC